MLRYAQQLSLPDIGISGQEKLKNSSVLIIGLGGLGIPILQILSGAGVGRIGLMDGDVISISNLHRQFIYKEDQLEESKVKVAKEFISSHNSEINVEVFPEFLTKENYQKTCEMIGDFDIVIDATDNVQSSNLISAMCVNLKKPCIYGGVYQNTGQIALFNFKGSPTYHETFRGVKDDVPSCNTSGVKGSVTSIIGSIMANETLKIILNSDKILSGILFQIDLTTYQISIFNL